MAWNDNLVVEMHQYLKEVLFQRMKDDRSRDKYTLNDLLILARSEIH